MKYQISMAAAFLYEIGVTFHDVKTIVNKQKEKLYDVYLCDSITQSQQDKIAAWNPNIRFFTTTKQYAPEIKSIGIGFPKAAVLRKLKA